MYQNTTNRPTAQQLMRDNLMLAALARRVVRLYHAGDGMEARREYEALLSNYGEAIKQDLDTLIAALAVAGS